MKQPFSRQLQDWLSSGHSKTLKDLTDHFAEKSFAIIFLLLMAIPALPLPTGGVTHVFEIIVMLLALELIAGRRSVWLPRKWRRRALPKKLRSSVLPRLIKIIRRLERYSRPRLSGLLNHTIYRSLTGFIVLVLTAFAFLAPPFSGLDTLPSLGVVLISLALILEDIILSLIGLIVGAVGIGLVIALGSFALKLL